MIERFHPFDPALHRNFAAHGDAKSNRKHSEAIMRWFYLAVPAMFLCASAPAQTPAAQNPRNQVAGTVAGVDHSARRLSLKSDKGGDVAVSASEKTLVLRIPPGETDPKKGTRISLDDIAAGDRVVAISRQAEEGKPVEASAILVMSSSDVARVHQKEMEDWRKRGVTGTVVSADPGGAIALKSGARTLTIQPSAKTDYRRYSADSARFSDTRPSSISEVKPGDQMRVLGDRSPDGNTISAERIVFGTFRQIAATIKSIDPASGEIKVTDLAGKKPLLLKVSPDSTMRKLPEMQARMLARRYAPGGQAAGGPPNAGADRSVNAPPDRALAGGNGRGGDIAQMLDRLPALPLSELKPGDAIMVSTTMGSDPSRVTVVTLLAGVEPLLTASPEATRDIMGGWNLGAGTGEGM
jgi:hypothetical protein